MKDDRPQYDGYKRPSPFTCLVGVIIAFLILGAFYAIILVGFPDLRARVTYPLLAVALLVLVGGGIYYLATNRQRRIEHADQDAQRKVADDWVAKELKESPYHLEEPDTREDE